MSTSPQPLESTHSADIAMSDDGATPKDPSSRTVDMLADLTLDSDREAIGEEHSEKFDKMLAETQSWSDGEQVAFVKRVLAKMSHYQLGRIDRFLRPMLQRDFIASLPSALSEQILLCLDARSLAFCEVVSTAWRDALATGALWRKLIEAKVRSDELWRGLSEKRLWKKYLMCTKENACKMICQDTERDYTQLEGQKYETTMLLHNFYRGLYPYIVGDIDNIESNWRKGKHQLKRINCRSENSKGVYCLQYDDDQIVSGLRDNTIKIWNRSDLSCSQTLTGHTGSVLCLQYDDQVIISGSSDSTVRVWDVRTGECLNTLIHHCEAVLHLRFHNGIMVTCSKDRSIAVWTMVSPREINLRRVLLGHRAAVNVVDFDSTYIVSASGDRTIKVWSADSCEYIRTLSGHKRGIACLQYRDRLVVSGSSDNTIRLWNILCGACLRVLEGHEELVRCIRFDNKRIVSGAYDGKIKVWDLAAAMDPRSLPGSLCLATLTQHTGRVFRLQFDDFQIVSSSHDDTILIWDFLDADEAPGAPNTGLVGGMGTAFGHPSFPFREGAGNAHGPFGGGGGIGMGGGFLGGGDAQPGEGPDAAGPMDPDEADDDVGGPQQYNVLDGQQFAAMRDAHFAARRAENLMRNLIPGGGAFDRDNVMDMMDEEGGGGGGRRQMRMAIDLADMPGGRADERRRRGGSGDFGQQRAPAQQRIRPMRGQPPEQLLVAMQRVERMQAGGGGDMDDDLDVDGNEGADQELAEAAGEEEEEDERERPPSEDPIERPHVPLPPASPGPNDMID